MPIVALEGPDRCGKSTMLEALEPYVYGAKFCSSIPYMEDLLEHAPKVEARQERLWSQLYQSGMPYVVDRSFTLTPEVYSRYKQRELLLDPAPWRKLQLIVYFDVPVDVLRRRHAEDGDKFDPDDYEKLIAAYESVLSSYNFTLVDQTWSAEKLGKMITKHFAKCRLLGKP